MEKIIPIFLLFILILPLSTGFENNQNLNLEIGEISGGFGKIQNRGPDQGGT